jgi:hypothetical protein
VRAIAPLKFRAKTGVHLKRKCSGVFSLIAPIEFFENEFTGSY